MERSVIRVAGLMAAICLLAAVAQAGEEKSVDGVLHVMNEARPSGGDESWQLEELWRTGGEEGEVLFGVVGQVRVDEEGNIYMLDSQLSEIKVFSPDGEYVKTLSREGDGPGETRQPNNMDLLEDGRIVICQVFPAKVTIIDRAGDPAGGFTIGGDPTEGGFGLMRGVRSRGGNLVFGVENAQQIDPGHQKRITTLGSYDLEGALQQSYTECTWTFDFTRFVVDDHTHLDFATRRFDVGPDGRVYAAPDRDRYVVNVYRPDGTLDRIVEREYTQRKRTGDEVAELRELFEMSVRQIPIEIDIDIADTEPPINWFLNGVQVRDDGNLWVLTDDGMREQPDGVMQTYDVFDPKGDFVKQVSIRCPGDSQEDTIFFMGEDRLLLVTGFLDAVRGMIGGGASDEEEEEPEPMELICYKVTGVS